MKEIKCPNCGEVFTIDEEQYLNIASQVKNEEFSRELDRRVKELVDLKEKEHKLELDKAIQSKSLTETMLKNEITLLKETKESEVKQAKESALLENSKRISELENEIANMKKIKEMEIESLKKDVSNARNEEKIKVQSEIDRLNSEIKFKDEEVNRLKDFKLKLSTKLVGETLEQHCFNEFNRIRPFFGKNVSFEKDNKVSASGSKGDFIYREFSEDGAEIISIMFDMKNENDETATKKKNEDFLAELDKDRKEKKCEYAVLVSMLEAESEYYNSGIADVSHRYEKMYVVRPQCFVSIITLLRSAALNALDAKNEIVELKNRNIDVTDFENKLYDFQDAFSKNCETATKHFEAVIKNIDDMISKLSKTKDELITTGNQLRLANNKAQDVTIKKLTYGNKTMQEMFKKGE